MPLDEVTDGDQGIPEHNIAPVALNESPSIEETLALFSGLLLVNAVDLYRTKDAKSDG